MLSKKQLDEIKSKIESFQNPVFLYDNDLDGLCSYALLKRMLGRGKGVIVRSYPSIDPRYAKKCLELNADGIVILDRPSIGQAFIDEIKSSFLPIVWIDHHDEQDKIDYENISIYNPLHSKQKSEEPVTYWIWKLAERKEDIWIALMGCIGDHYLPEFASEYGKKFPDWLPKKKEPFDAYYNSEIGKLAQALSFGIKDSPSNVVTLQATLASALSPEELQSELNSPSAFGKKYRQMKSRYLSLIEEAKSQVSEKLLFFTYGGESSMSSDLANELSYSFPKKIIAVIYTKGAISNLSLRGKNVRKIFENLSKKIEGLQGGGHEEAVGARIPTAQIEQFKKELLKILV